MTILTPTAVEKDFGGIIPVRRILRGSAARQSSSSAAAGSQSTAASSAAATPVAPLSAVPMSVASAGAATNKLRTLFAKESDEVIEARKAASRLPLKRDPEVIASAEAGEGVPSEDWYACDAIPIPVRPAWQGLTAAQVDAQEQSMFAKWLQDIYARFGLEQVNQFELNLEGGHAA